MSRRGASRWWNDEGLRVTVICWGLSLVGAALVVISASSTSMLRCADGWTNVGQARWSHAVAACLVNAPTFGRAVWLLVGSEGSTRLRWVAVVVAVVLPITTIALCIGVLPEPPSVANCLD